MAKKWLKHKCVLGLFGHGGQKHKCNWATFFQFSWNTSCIDSLFHLNLYAYICLLTLMGADTVNNTIFLAYYKKSVTKYICVWGEKVQFLCNYTFRWRLFDYENNKHTCVL